MRLLAAGLWLGLSYVWIRASASPADWNDVPSTIQSLDPRPVGTERMLPARRRLRGPPAARQRSSDASIESSNETGANQTATRTSAPAELHDFAARAPGPPPPSWAIVSKPQVTMCTMESFGDTTFGPCYTVTPDLTGSGKNCRKMPPFTGSGSFVVSRNRVRARNLLTDHTRSVTA